MVITLHTVLTEVKTVRDGGSQGTLRKEWHMTEGTPNRRERVRATTIEEITTTARRLLVEQGPDAVSLRAIAREMGMTAPGLYRYYDSREQLLRHVIGEIFRELAGDVRQAIDAVVPDTVAIDAVVPDTVAPPLAPAGATRAVLTRKLIAACREFRRWALTHKDEFTLLFGVPMPGLSYDGSQDFAEQCAMEFAGTFLVLFLELWTKVPLPVLADAEIDPALQPQLEKFRDKFRAPAPDGALLVFLRCWVLLYGAVAMEVFGHLDFALDDSAPMFELTLQDLALKIGLDYPAG
jgi:AcrR family transcriptional regulator